MIKLTARMKERGEREVRRLSDNAQWVYDNTDPMAVYEYSVFDEGLEWSYPHYAIRSCLGDRDDLTWEELADILEYWGGNLKKEQQELAYYGMNTIPIFEEGKS